MNKNLEIWRNTRKKIENYVSLLQSWLTEQKKKSVKHVVFSRANKFSNELKRRMVKIIVDGMLGMYYSLDLK